MTGATRAANCGRCRVEVHAGHQLQQVLGHQGGGGVARPAAAAAGVGDQDVHPAPGLGHVVDHREDGVAVGDVELEAQGVAAAGLDLVHRAVGGHRLRLVLELGRGFQVEVRDRDLGPQAGQPAGVGAPQPARRPRDDRHLPIEFAHRTSSSSVLASPDLSGFAQSFRFANRFALPIVSLCQSFRFANRLALNDSTRPPPGRPARRPASPLRRTGAWTPRAPRSCASGFARNRVISGANSRGSRPAAEPGR